jgi:hypothetical protein
MHGHDFESDCSESCPFECFSIEYSFKVSTSLYPTKSREDDLYYNYGYNRSISDYKYTSQAFAKIYIYYKSMTYTRIDAVKSMEQYDLFSLFGGILGLFLGNYCFLLFIFF